MENLYAGDIPLEEFIPVIEAFSFTSDHLLLAFSPAHWVFQTFSLHRDFLLSTDQGRIFSPEGELKWRRIEKQMRMVYIGKSTPPPCFFHPVHENDAPKENPFLKGDLTEEDLEGEKGKISQSSGKRLLLWGERTVGHDEWIEQQVPHRFNYPITGKQSRKGRVTLVIKQWFNESGFPVFSRYHHLEESEEK